MEFAYHACIDPLHHCIAVTTLSLFEDIIEDSLEKRVLNVLTEQRAHNYREISRDKLQLSILDSFTVDHVIDRYIIDYTLIYNVRIFKYSNRLLNRPINP